MFWIIFTTSLFAHACFQSTTWDEEDDCGSLDTTECLSGCLEEKKALRCEVSLLTDQVQENLREIDRLRQLSHEQSNRLDKLSKNQEQMQLLHCKSSL